MLRGFIPTLNSQYTMMDAYGIKSAFKLINIVAEEVGLTDKISTVKSMKDKINYLLDVIGEE